MNKELISLSPIWVLFFIFLILKLCHVVEWSWWWITAPLWGSIALCVLVVLICSLLYIRKNKKTRRQSL